MKTILPSQELQKLIDTNIINATNSKMQPASIDLSLGDTAYRVHASFLAQKEPVEHLINEYQMTNHSLADGMVLIKDAVYVIPLQESLDLPFDLSGYSNPKSSIGRLDIFVRMITDYSNRFDNVEHGYKGKLYLVVISKSFNVKIKMGQHLNQLRIFKHYKPGASYLSNEDIKDLYSTNPLLYNRDNSIIPLNKCIDNNSINLSINVRSNGIIGYRSLQNGAFIDLEKLDHYNIGRYWEVLYVNRNRLILIPESFYIFNTTEKISIPIDYAGEMLEFDAGAGELRTHYAGFFDPGFGCDNNIRGTTGVVEIRPHDVPFIINDKQVLFKLQYLRMDSTPSIRYGKSIGSNYQNQTLTLSKYFKQSDGE